MGGYQSMAGAYAAYPDPAMVKDPNITPGLGDELPIPKMEAPAFAAPPNPQQTLPAGAGFAGTGGQLANLAANFLHGWMEGRNLKRDREERSAKQKLTSTYTAYTMAMQVAQNPDLPQQQRDAAAATIPGLKGAYIDLVRAYGGGTKPQKGGKGASGGGKAPAGGNEMQPSGGGEGGSGGFGGHLKNAMGVLAKVMNGGGEPEYFQSGIADLLEQTMPSAPAALSPQQQAARSTAQATSTAAQHQMDVDKLQDHLSQLHQARQDAVASGVQDKVAQIDQQIETTKNQLAALGVGQEQLPGTRAAQMGAMELSAQNLAAQKAALEKLRSGSSFAMLNPAEKISLGWNPNGANGELEAYFSQVGPNKQFANEFEAAQAFNRDKRRLAAAGRFQQQWEFVRDNEESVLQHLLQNPDVARQYGLERPLQPGEQVPDWIVSQETLKTIQQQVNKPLSAMEVRTARDNIAREVLQQNPQFSDILSYKDAKGTTVVGLNPTAKPKSGFFGFGGESQEQFEQRRQQAMQAMQQKAIELGFQPNDIMQLGLGQVPGYNLAAPGGQIGVGGPQAAPGITPPPQSAPQSAAAVTEGQRQQYKVTSPDGKSEVRPLTAAEVQAAKSNPKFKNFQFEVVSAAGQAAKPQAPTPPASQPEAKGAPQASPAAPAPAGAVKPAAKKESAPAPQSGGAPSPLFQRIEAIRKINPGVADEVTKKVGQIIQFAMQREKEVGGGERGMEIRRNAIRDVDTAIADGMQRAPGTTQLAATQKAKAESKAAEEAQHKGEAEAEARRTNELFSAFAKGMSQSQQP